jgi:hypothetical protein
MLRSLFTTSVVLSVAIYAHFVGPEEEDSEHEQEDHHHQDKRQNTTLEATTSALEEEEDALEEEEEEEEEEGYARESPATWGFFADITPEVPKYSRVHSSNRNQQQLLASDPTKSNVKKVV